MAQDNFDDVIKCCTLACTWSIPSDTLLKRLNYHYYICWYRQTPLSHHLLAILLFYYFFSLIPKYMVPIFSSASSQLSAKVYYWPTYNIDQHLLLANMTSVIRLKYETSEKIHSLSGITD